MAIIRNDFMNNYLIEKSQIVDSTVQIILLNVKKNVRWINRRIIPRDQLDEIRRYKFQHDSDKRLLVRSFLYEFLANNFGVTNFDLVFNEYHKPFLKSEPGINFSFSYAGDYAILGISINKRLGIDIEYIDPIIDIEMIAPEIMCASELEQFSLFNKNSIMRRVYFFRLFSTKESIIKAFGTGLYFDVKRLNTLDGNQYFWSETMFVCCDLNEYVNQYTMAICYEQERSF
jgi:4'-phosphopantetheinyl transferase